MTVTIMTTVPGDNCWSEACDAQTAKLPAFLGPLIECVVFYREFVVSPLFEIMDSYCYDDFRFLLMKMVENFETSLVVIHRTTLKDGYLQVRFRK